MTMQQTRKVCANGHWMEADWEVCPYCPSTRAGASPLARTVKIDATRVEGALKEPPKPVAPAARHTEILRRGPAPAGVAWLVAATGPERGRTHRVETERTIVGAAQSCDITLDNDHVSDRHASLRFQDGAYLITDLDSTNGVSVNGEAVHQQALNDGDRIALGASEWVFKCVVFDET